MSELVNPHGLILLIAAACVGSFLGVLIDRLPSGRPIFWARSSCSHCHQRLAPYDLVPIIGWLVNRGRCRNCGEYIGLFSLVIEILAVLVAIWAMAVVPGMAVWATCVLGWVLLVLAVLDWRYLQLPDMITLPLIPVGLLVSWLLAPERVLDHIIGAVAGYLFVACIAFAYLKLRQRPGIGLGDGKLLAAAGAWLGWDALPTVILLAAGLGLFGALLQARLAGRLDPYRKLPFGSYLTAGFWLVWLYGPLGVT